MPNKNTYISGQWNFHCDSCGQKLKSGVTKKRWDGFQVCPECWEPRQPQDFVRTKEDKISVPWVRKQPDVFIDGSEDKLIDGYIINSTETN